MNKLTLLMMFRERFAQNENMGEKLGSITKKWGECRLASTPFDTSKSGSIVDFLYMKSFNYE